MKNIHLFLLTTLFLCSSLSAFSADPAMEKVRTGDYREASKLLQQDLKDNPEDWGKRLLLIDALETLGDKRQLKEQQNILLGMYRQGKITSAPALTALAQSVRMENPKTAAKFFDEAHKADDKYAEAYVRAGFLYYERFACPKAKFEFDKAAELEPKNTDALAGLAFLAVNDGNYQLAKELADKVLSENPASGQAASINAGIFLVEKEYDSCRRQIDKILAVNPNELHTLSVLSAYHDTKGEEKEREEVLSRIKEINSNDPEAYVVMSEMASRRYNFKDALKWAKKASEVNPGDWTGYFLAGMALIRLGEEKEGYEQLDTSFRKNPYNIWAYNVLQAMDRDFKGGEYVLKETEHFAVKLTKSDEAVLWPYLEKSLEESYARLTGRYAFKPEGPKQYKGKILVLFLATHQDFSVRTVGLPSLPAAGVCFGKVVLMPSPRFFQNSPVGEFSWCAVLDHEFMHVISLQMTNYEIPRWFTEGLSSMEEKGDHFNGRVMFSAAVKKKLLLPLENMELGFIAGGMLTALHYYQAELICGYIERKYGFEKLVEMCDLFKKGMASKDVIEGVTGKKIAIFGKEIDEYYSVVDSEFSEYLKSSGLEWKKSSDEKDEEEEDVPKDGKMKKPDPAWKVKLNAILDEKKTDEAIGFLENYLKYDNSTHEVFKLLGNLYLEKDRSDDAIKCYESGFLVNPYDAETHLSAARLYKKAGNSEKAAREYRILKFLDKDNLEAVEYLEGKGK